MPIKWTPEEELKFITAIKNGISLEKLSNIHNRTQSALELRLKKIIYSKILDGMSKNKISSLLNISLQNVEQYYYSYMSWLESKQTKQIKQTEQIEQPKINKITKINKNNKHQYNNTNIELEIKLLKKENKLLKLLLSDISIRKYIYDRYRNRKLDEKTMKILEGLIKSGLLYTL
jgi:hypothetical protein